MELKGKGDEAILDEDTIKQLKVIMTWNEAIDFDLGALYKTKDGEEGMIYFRNKGDLNKSPFILAGADKGVGDTAGDHKEKIVISKLDHLAEVHIFAWDFGSIEKGINARFQESGVMVAFVDDKNESFEVKPDAGDLGNVCCLASIKSEAIGSKLSKVSKAGTLKEFNSSNQFWDIVKAS